LKLGAELNSIHAKTIAKLRKDKSELEPADYDRARGQAEAYLNSFPPDERTNVVRGAMANLYISDAEGDNVLWLTGEKTDTGRRPSIAQVSLQALREIGILDEL